MNNQEGSPPRKGPRWIVDQIAAAFEAARVAPPAGERLSGPEVEELVSQALEEELERVGEEEPSPPAPLPRAGEG